MDWMSAKAHAPNSLKDKSFFIQMGAEASRMFLKKWKLLPVGHKLEQVC